MPDGPRDVARIVAAIEPFDDVERSHQADVLAWLDSTPDVYRRVKPAATARREAREELGLQADMSRFLAKIRAMLG